MCGIAGIWQETDPTPVRRMVTALSHRGPDGAALHVRDGAVIGHSRLAIIDPEGGEQPLLSRDGASALVANGMIYNHKSLRRRLGGAAFRSRSDSEAILHLVRRDGADAADQLDGMFAFVYVDGERLIAARDPIGIKPLYTGRRNGKLCFASEIKALAGIAEDIQEFPAGHVYCSDAGYAPYYRVPDGAPRRADEDALVRDLRATLEIAVVKRLQSDVPLGAFLSGGLDSSIVAALARRHLPELHTFAVGLEGSRDVEAARRVARHIGSIHHERIVRPEEVVEALPEILFRLESYDQDLVRSAVPCYFVSELASEHVKVVLTGEGADELFAGYSYYRDYREPAALHREMRRSITAMHNVNLQRVDRMTMAHGLEARVPFLDRAMIELGLSVDPALKLRAANGRRVEKWILRKSFEDLLPRDIVWRDKEQFDEGSGMADFLGRVGHDLAGRVLGADGGEHLRAARSREESCYRALLAEAFDEPAPVLDLVAHWNDRPAA